VIPLDAVPSEKCNFSPLYPVQRPILWIASK
jgi:hypothetical protein